MGRCISELKVSASLPFFISIGLAVFSFIIISIYYYCNERRLSKKFYDKIDGRKTPLNTVEKEGIKAEVDNDIIAPPHVVTAAQTFEKVNGKMVEAPIRITMIRPPPRTPTVQALSRRSHEHILPSHAVTPLSHTPLFALIFVMNHDANECGLNAMNELKESILAEAHRVKNEKLGEREKEIQIGDFIISKIKMKLEELTNNQPWICHGRINNYTSWVVYGHESLIHDHINLNMAVKITIIQPISIIVFGYKVQEGNLSGHNLHTAVTQRLSAQSLAPATTPLMNSLVPVTPILRSRVRQMSASALKKINTAEPIYQLPPQTPGTKAMTPSGNVLKQAGSKKPNTPPRTPPQPIPSKKGQSRICEAVTPVARTPIPIQTPTILPTPINTAVTQMTGAATPVSKTKQNSAVKNFPTLATPKKTQNSGAKYVRARKGSSRSDDTQVTERLLKNPKK